MTKMNCYTITWHNESVSKIDSYPPIICDGTAIFHGDDIKNNQVDDRQWIVPLSSIMLISQQNIYTEDEILAQIEALK